MPQAALDAIGTIALMLMPIHIFANTHNMVKDRYLSMVIGHVPYAHTHEAPLYVQLIYTLFKELTPQPFYELGRTPVVQIF